MNLYFNLIIVFLVGSALFKVLMEALNIACLAPRAPAELGELYSDDKFLLFRSYYRENTIFEIIRILFMTLLIVFFLLSQGLQALDHFSRFFDLNPVLTGLVFIGSLSIILWAVSLPFSIFHTFSIEQRYGFNRTSPVTFTIDQLKALTLGCILGGLMISFVLWFFNSTGKTAWLYVWLGLFLFQIILYFVAPILIMPLFNKYSPLADGELKKSIEDYAKSQDFKLKGIFTMDGSRRSTKANAFFTGFGKSRRIVLFDTLIDKHPMDELLAVLAHEVGHFKKKHILKLLFISFLSNGILFYLFSLFLNNPGLHAAFEIDTPSVHVSLILFGLLYTPVSRLISLLGLYMSRKHEYEADHFSIVTFPHKGALVSALKRLSVDSFSNPTPHPLKVFFEYSHPPLLERIKAMER